MGSRLLIVLAVTFALLVTACGGATQPPAAAGSSAGTTPPPPAATKVTFRLDWKPGAQHAPFYLAKDKGYYAKEGIDLEIVAGSGSSDSVKFLGTNTVDIALVDALVLVQAREKQVPLKAIGAYYQHSPISIISPAAKPLKTPQDLIGKKVGSKKSSATYQGLLVFLAANKLQPEQVNLVDIGFGVQPLLVGQVDALMGFAMNEAIEAELAGTPVYQMPIADYGVKSYGLTVATSDKFSAEHGKLLAGFLKATRQGMLDAAANPADAVAAVVKAVPELTKEHETKVLAATSPVWAGADSKDKGFLSQTEAQWKQTIDTAASLKLVEKAPAVADVFSNDFLGKNV